MMKIDEEETAMPEEIVKENFHEFMVDIKNATMEIQSWVQWVAENTKDRLVEGDEESLPGMISGVDSVLAIVDEIQNSTKDIAEQKEDDIPRIEKDLREIRGQARWIRDDLEDKLIKEDKDILSKIIFEIENLFTRISQMKNSKPPREKNPGFRP